MQKGKDLMAQKKEIEIKHGPFPLDESWWTAVLAEAESQHPSKPAPHSKPPTEIDAQAEERATLPAESAQDEEQQGELKDIDWQHVKDLYDQDLVIHLEVSDYNRGGLLVSGNNIQGFVPASHLVGLSKKRLKQEREELLSTYIGQSLRLKVIECDQPRGRIVFSQRAAQTDSGKRLELLNHLQVGDCRAGRVTTITDFGVFVDLGGVEGLIHISELSWGRVCHPDEIVSIGQEIRVFVLQVERDKARVALSLKRLVPNPWESVQARYSPGQIADAVITNIVSFGAFARLDDGLDGLIHISEFGDQAVSKDIENTISEGQQVKVCILHIDPERQRLGLSLQQVDGGVQ
jgi:small subunit ribosomal protein S1